MKVEFLHLACLSEHYHLRKSDLYKIEWHIENHERAKSSNFEEKMCLILFLELLGFHSFLTVFSTICLFLVMEQQSYLLMDMLKPQSLFENVLKMYIFQYNLLNEIFAPYIDTKNYGHNMWVFRWA